MNTRRNRTATALAAGSVMMGLGATAALVGAAPAATAAGSCTPTAATAQIDTEVPAYGEKIAFHGSGWLTCSGTASTVAVKMTDTANTKYARPDTTVNPDTTVWAVVKAQFRKLFSGG